ncbi:MAG: TolC family protein [Balneolaceae bacterium]|nr:MAG: TolC family protein [Balneolaceae bacterium]
MAQDTLRVNLSQFIERGLQTSGQVAYEQRAVDLAQNRVNTAQSQRILPRVEFSSQHGVIPGVVSKDPRNLPPGQFYLDPNLENDWEDWAIFTRAELSAIQPIYSWGAIRSAVDAARSGARAAEFQFDAVKAEAELQLYELYYSYLLALEISRILDEADREINRVERELYRMRDEGDPDIKESDIFKFEIFKSEFQVQKVEVREGMDFVRRIWNYALQASPNQVFIPEENFLDPIAFQLQDFNYYLQMAINARPELRGVESGIDALRSGLDAARAQQYPLFFLGITGSYANTPNRPRQSNPFIINNTNYASGGVGFGIRQNLNFSGIRNTVDRAEIEYRRVNDLHKAVTDGITLEINNKYREAVIAEVKVRQTEEALVTARNWVRNEQLNYDIGFGDVEDLLDSVQKELELRLLLKQNVFNLNKKVAALYKAGGIPIQQLSIN